MKTNRLNKQKLGRRKWKATTGNKLMKFLEIACYVGLVTYPKISDYWSKKKDLQKCSYSISNGKEQIPATGEVYPFYG